MERTAEIPLASMHSLHERNNAPHYAKPDSSLGATAAISFRLPEVAVRPAGRDRDEAAERSIPNAGPPIFDALGLVGGARQRIGR